MAELAVAVAWLVAVARSQYTRLSTSKRHRYTRAPLLVRFRVGLGGGLGGRDSNSLQRLQKTFVPTRAKLSPQTSRKNGMVVTLTKDVYSTRL